MTPDLASFTVSWDAGSNDAPPAWDDVEAVIKAALQRGFTIVPDRTAPKAAERRTWFDTFDWRLFKAGLLLEYVPVRRGSELRLTRIAGRPGAPPRDPGVMAQPVTGWQPSRPHPAGDIPPGSISDRVARLIAPRVLLPVATVTETTHVSRLLNEDAKTVARLVIERPVLAPSRDAAGRAAPGGDAAGRGASGGDAAGRVASGQARNRRSLAPRLEIQPVRGYPGQARRAADLLEETEGVTRAGGTVLEDTLAALGRRPGDYSNKVDAPITAAMPASQAVARILLRLLDTLDANTQGVQRDIDTEFLHDFRVAVRRSRAGLKLFGDTLSSASASASAGIRAVTPDVATAAAEFKWLGDLTTPTRDLDVHLLGFDDMAAGLRAAKPDHLEPFRNYLKERRVREFRVLARELRSPRFGNLTRQWRAALAPIGAGLAPIGADGGRGRGASIRSGEISAATLAAERTRHAFVKVAKRGGAITPDSPHESLHDLRKRCKELRYALEFFAPLHDRATYAAVVGDLKKLQDCLGEFQDSEVQIAEIASLATAMQTAGEAPAVTLLAMGEIMAGLAASQAAARADFERRFAAFAGIDGRRRMSVLLRGGAL